MSSKTYWEFEGSTSVISSFQEDDKEKGVGLVYRHDFARITDAFIQDAIDSGEYDCQCLKMSC